MTSRITVLSTTGAAGILAALVVCSQGRGATVSEASAPRITVVGAAAPRALSVDVLDRFGSRLATPKATIQSGRLFFTASPAAYRFVIQAPGFEQTSVEKSELSFGVTLTALARIRLKTPETGKGPAGVLAWRAGVVSRLDRVSASDPDLFWAPWGRTRLLVESCDERVALTPAIVLAPGEERAIGDLSFSSPLSAQIVVANSLTKPVAGASIRWQGSGPAEEASLFEHWMGGKQLERTNLSGVTRVAKVPPVRGTFTIQAKGYRVGVARSVPASPTSLQDPSRPQEFRGLLRPLPVLRVVVRPEAGVEPPFRLVLTRRPDRSQMSAPPQNLFEGPIPGWQRDFSVELAGEYRAVVVAGRRQAAAQSSFDVSEGAPEFQDLSVRFARKRITGLVTTRTEPVPGVQIRAYPDASILRFDEAPLSTARTDASGHYEVDVFGDLKVALTATLPDGAEALQTHTVDLRQADTAEQDFNLSTGSLIIRVLDAERDSPISGAVLKLERSDTKGASLGVTPGQTNEAGELKLSQLGEGFLRFSIEAEGFAKRFVERFGVREEENPTLEVRMVRKAPFRIRLRDESGQPVPGAEALYPKNRDRIPRTAELASLGSTDSHGELILRQLAGVEFPAFLVAPGFSAQLVKIPAAADPSGDPDRNTLDVVMEPFSRSVFGVRVQSVSGPENSDIVLRRDATIFFSRDGVDVPLPVVLRVMSLNGLRPSDLILPDGAGAHHLGEALARGQYTVFALAPGTDRPDQMNRVPDLIDPLGTVVLPLVTDIDLRWAPYRKSFKDLLGVQR